MNRIQTACFALLASAFVLTAILIVQLDSKATQNTAHAEGQNVAQPGFQLMTARTKSGEESLFVLDGRSGKIVVYKPNPTKKRLEWIKTLPLK